MEAGCQLKLRFASKLGPRRTIFCVKSREVVESLCSQQTDVSNGAAFAFAMIIPDSKTVEDASFQLDAYRAEFAIHAYMALLGATFSLLAIVTGTILLTSGTAPCDLKIDISITNPYWIIRTPI